MTSSDRAHRSPAQLTGDTRDPLAGRAALVAARERSMSERLELALSWNAVAAELREGLSTARKRA